MIQENQKRESRKKQTAEVFTPDRLVNQILSKLPKEVWKKGKTFCDPAVGNGQFLVAILHRKIMNGHKPLKALQSIYGVDIMRDNIQECRKRLLKECVQHGEHITEEHIQTVMKNIVWINQNRYPGGSLQYDFSFNNSIKKENVDRWMKWIHDDNILSKDDLPGEDEVFPLPNDVGSIFETATG